MLSKVELIDHMGTDLSVVNAARVSFDKTSSFEIYDNGQNVGVAKLKNSDAKLIKYLATHNHWSPFAHTSVSFRISAPIVVARQLVKHQIGLTWNEVSRRYVDSAPEFYTVDAWRKRAENKKQGSSEETIEFIDRLTRVDTLYWNHMKASLKVYETMLDGGVCPEQARLVLPQAMMTEWIWTGSLYAMARVCDLRLDAHAQHETRLVAIEMAKYMKQLFPVSWKVLIEDKWENATIANNHVQYAETARLMTPSEVLSDKFTISYGSSGAEYYEKSKFNEDQ